ncbi:MAG: hypothetical protein II483_10145 [Lachnospiraceae bacterium]|nr:hypothetical protein [Lachnospiraceae bacterium]
MSKQYNDKEWIKYETFVDPRDNQEYRTIEVTDKSIKTMQYVIMSSNLNYGKMVTAETATYSDEAVEKFCYNDDPWYCENGFGGLYTWSEAMGLPRACDTVALGSTPECPEATGFGESGRRQGICPDGWHVMNEFEWRGMPTSEGFGAKPMLSQVFRGSDDIGLAVLLGGMSDPDLIEKKIRPNWSVWILLGCRRNGFVKGWRCIFYRNQCKFQCFNEQAKCSFSPMCKGLLSFFDEKKEDPAFAGLTAIKDVPSGSK